MMHALLVLLLSISSCYALPVSDSSDPIVLSPISSKSGPEKLLIIVNGAYVPNTDYQEVAQAIQQASDLKLWVAIPSFLANCPNPGQIDSKISGSVTAVKAAGFQAIEPDKDAFVAGHSLGGIFSQGVVKKGGYAGLILLGSYLSSLYSNTVDTFPFPVFTLAGELDGLTRITRIVREWQGLQRRILKEGPDAAFHYPVVALPGQSHSQFCSNVNVTSFGSKDLRPSVSWPAAHAAIGSAVSDFLALVTGNDPSARQTMDERAQYTKQLLLPFITAQSYEASSWCESSQHLVAPNVTTKFDVSATVCQNAAVFDTKYPSVAGSSKKVTVVDETEHHSNPTDSSLTDVAATEVDCKSITQAGLMKAFGEHGTSAPDSCVLANQAAIAQARQLLQGTETLKRYDAEGKQFVVDEDSKYSTGITWQAARFGFSTDSTNVKIQSPRLVSGTTMLCKLLSPSRVVEYMMVDGLPRFDGSVP
jgi:hypothetical protein